MPKTAARRTFALSCAALTLLAFALRAADLTGRGFWLDESFTLLRVEGSWADMLANRVWRQGIDTVDLNPPLYFALLKLWSGLAGASDFALRLFSVGWSVLCVPLAAVLGARAHSRRVGLLAALFALTCPALQWYGWELRNYSIAAALAALNGYLALRVARPRTGDRALMLIAVWVLSAMAGLFAHYTFAGWIAGQLAYAALTVFSKRATMRALPWRAIALAAGALVLLLVISGLGASLARAIEVHVAPRLAAPDGAAINPIALLLELVGPMQFGFNAADPLGGLLNFVVLALACAGFWVGRRSLGPLAFGALATLFMWWGLALVLSNRASFRYFITLVPAMYVAAACGALALARVFTTRTARAVTATALSALVLGPHAHGLTQSFVRTPTYQDDWRALARDLRDNWRPGDALVINLNTPEAILARELADLPIDVHAFVALNRAFDAKQLTPADFRARYRRIWLADTGASGFSDADIKRWFEPEMLVRDRAYAGRTTVPTLRLYPLRDGLSASPPADQRSTDAPGDAALALVGWRVVAGNPFHASSNVIVRATWRRTSTELRAASLRAQVRVGDGVLYDITLSDALETAPPAWGARDAAVWTTDHVIPLPPGLTRAPLDLQFDVSVDGSVVQQSRRALNDEELAVIRDLPEPDLAPLLSASDVALARAEFPATVRVGQVLPVVLSWRRLTDDAQPWETLLELKPSSGVAVARAQAPTGVDPNPLSAWPRGRWTRDLRALPLPAVAVPGDYALVLTRLRDGRMLDSATLGRVRVEAHPPSPLPTDATLPLDATIGEFTLLGLKVPEIARGQTVDIRTHWRVDRMPTRDGVITLRLFYPDGTPGPQDDNKPERGARTTLTYSTGDGIDQSHQIMLPADAPPGLYTITIGVYDAEGGLRWPARQGGAPAKDDLIVVANVSVP
jgi:hypothetical protein